ncbi:hypothetical protein HMPREF1868_00265 [Olsenella sp. DNF00959]|nr:hypothetical protein HMPREF1868_00265 [Olsenella sp. DNF00959]
MPRLPHALATWRGWVRGDASFAGGATIPVRVSAKAAVPLVPKGARPSRPKTVSN